ELPGPWVATLTPHKSPYVDGVVDRATHDLNQMREQEGAAMARTLLDEIDQISEGIVRIGQWAPHASARYAERLEGKIQKILDRREIESQPVDLIREVQIYADRCDISEELTRLESHLVLFRQALGIGSPDVSDAGSPPSSDEAVGRKLDFIIQEMFRETNTTGAKAAAAEIAAEVVEIKCALERMRELVQNLE
ncbi:MAG: DUF1732 domain-containing protein, partial [Planctomycetota bacterium]